VWECNPSRKLWCPTWCPVRSCACRVFTCFSSEAGPCGRGCLGVQVVARVRKAVEAAAALASAAAPYSARNWPRMPAIDAALVAAGQPVFANLGSLQWQAGVNPTMEPDEVRDL
jgi:hypothetical protein